MTSSVLTIIIQTTWFFFWEFLNKKLIDLPTVSRKFARYSVKNGHLLLLPRALYELWDIMTSTSKYQKKWHSFVVNRDSFPHLGTTKLTGISIFTTRKGPLGPCYLLRRGCMPRSNPGSTPGIDPRSQGVIPRQFKRKKFLRWTDGRTDVTVEIVI